MKEVLIIDQTKLRKSLNNKMEISQKLLNQSLSDFLNTNTRKDRDRVLKHKYKLEAYKEILELI
jgi:hypothetical protein